MGTRAARSKFLFAIFAATLTLVAAFPSFAQFKPPVGWTARVEPAETRRGESVNVIIEAAIDDGWHVYALRWSDKDEGPLPTAISFPALGGLKLQGKLQQSPPKSERDPNFDVVVQHFDKKATFTQKLKIPDDHPLGAVSVEATVEFMVCSDTQCLPPSAKKLAAKFSVVEGAPRPQFVSDEPLAIVPAPRASLQVETFGKNTSENIWGFIALAFGAGLLSLLTPCVFPMIPITVSFFTKQNENKNAKPVTLALVYCAGIVGTFSILGLLLSVVFGAAGPNQLAANSFVNIAIAALFVVFALSLFGLFEIQAPAFLTNFFHRKSVKGNGYVGALFMGLTFTLAAFTCTVPFAGSVLAGAATGDRIYPIVGMLAYSMAFAFPFFFLALFPRLLASLPKSGGWLNSVKVVMGFLELAAAAKFISNADLIRGWDVFTPPVVLAGWTAVTAFTGIYLLGKFHFPHDTKTEHIGVGRMITSLACIALSLYLASGLFGQKLNPWIEAYLPLKQADKLTWLHTLDEGKAQARAEGKLIFIDFTGYTCTNCRFNELNVFTKPEVEVALKKFVLVRLYTDGRDPHWQENQNYQIEKFKTPALPYYAIMDADENVRATTGGLIRDAQEFLKMLEAAAQSPTK